MSNGLKFVFGARCFDAYKTSRLIEQFEQTRSKNTTWLLVVAYDAEAPGMAEVINNISELTSVRTLTIAAPSDSNRMTNRIFNVVENENFDFAFMARDTIQFTNNGWDGLYYNAAGYSEYPVLQFYDQENPVCAEAARPYPPLINRCLLKQIRDSFFTFNKYALKTLGYYDINNTPNLAAHEYIIRASDAELTDKYNPYDVDRSQNYIKCDPEYPPVRSDIEAKFISIPKQKLYVEYNDIKERFDQKQPIATFVMCLKNRKDRAIKSIKSIVTNRNLDHLDFIIVEDISDDMLNLSLFKFAKNIKHYIVDTGDSWNRSKLLNFGFKRAKTPLVASWDCDIKFPSRFGERLREVCNSLNFSKEILKISSKESANCTINGQQWNRGDIRGGMWLYSKNMVENVNGYDESFVEWGHEEMDFYERLQRMYPIAIREVKDIDTKCIVTHISHDDTLRGDCESNDNNYSIRCKHFNEKTTIVNINGWGNTPLLRKTMTGEFAEYLKGKSVAIIGPAPSVIGSRQRKKIDSYDIVIRINKALPVPTQMWKDTGKRCDILYNCLNTSEECGGTIDFEDLRDYDVKWIACPYPRKTEFNNDIIQFESRDCPVPLHIIDTELYTSIENYIGTRPNSGIGTILDILNYDVTEVYITGFTFFRGGYHKHYRGYSEEKVMDFMDQYGKHEQEPQRQIIKQMAELDSRIICDDQLKEILEEE